MRGFGSVVVTVFLGLSVAEPIPRLAARDAPTVDLGYSVYAGSYDAVNNINAFKGCVLVQLTGSELAD